MTSPTFYKFLRGALIAAALVFMPMYAFADYYVATTGSDSNSGTQVSPFKTILKGSQVAVPGDTIHVAPGTYTGGFVTSKSGTASARIRYISDTKWGAKIIPTSSSDHVWKNTGGYTDIIGFEITGLGVTNIARLGIYLTGGNSSVQNSHVHDIANAVVCTSSGGAGIEADDASGPINYSYIGNVIDHIGAAGCTFIQGLYLSSTGTIKNNLVYAVGAFGIHLWHNAHDVVIANNTVFGSGYGMVVGGGDFYNGYTAGAVNVHVANNIVFDNTHTGIVEEGVYGTNNTYTNNLVYQNPGGNLSLGSGKSNVNGISVDPQFVNYIRTGGGDYHLKSTSPAIDKGSVTYAPSNDLDGNVRPQGAGYDIGSYEYGAGGTTTIPPPPPPPSSSGSVSLTPASINFGSIAIGVSSPVLYATFTNSSSAVVTFNGNFVLTGDFATAGLGTCGASVAAGGSCTVSLKFTPTVTGTRTGILTINSNAAGSPHVVSLSGTGGTTVTPPPPPPPPAITVLTNGVTLTNLSGATGAQHMYQLTVPTGATNLRFVSSGGTGDFDLYVKFGSVPTTVAGGYDLKSDGATTAETISIPTPQAGTYYLLTNGWAAYSGVSLVGAYTAAVTSAPAVSLSPTSLNFGSVTVGSASTVQTVTITNSGSVGLIFPSSFTFTGDYTFGGTGTCTTGVTYAPNTSCTASVKFTPTVSGTRTGTLTITDNAANSPQVVQLTGTGGTIVTPPPPPPPPSVSLTPASINFGSIAIGASSPVFYATFTNNSTTVVTFNGNFALTGDFATAGLGTCGATVAAGASCTVSLKFTPTVTGTRTGTLTINSNAAGSPHIISLMGTGVTSSPTPTPTPTPTPSPTPTAAHYLYVAPTGSDSNSGTQSAPFRTILKASQVAVADTVIHVAAGTYSGGFTTAANGTATGRITYLSDTKWGAKIAGSGNSYIWLNTGNYVTVDGFELYGSGNQHGLISGPWSNYSDQDPTHAIGHHFIAKNNYIHDLAVNFCGSGGALTVFSFPGGSQLLNNIILNIDVRDAANTNCATQNAIYTHENGGTLISGNLVGGCGSTGIVQWHHGSRATIVNNTVFNCRFGIMIGQGSGDQTADGTHDNYVANNIIAHILNIAIKGNDALDVPNNQYRNNLIYQAGTNIQVFADSMVSGTILSDPKFTNYQADGSGDYSPQSTSPTIDAGLSSGATIPGNITVTFPTIDLAGISRPQGAAYDIGAYEYRGTPTTADTQAPSVPTSLTAGAVSSSQINLTWTASTDNVGVTGYKIFRGGTQITTVTGTTYSNTGLTASTAYTYTVAAYDAAGNTSAQSAAASATTQAAVINTGITTLTNGLVLTSLSGATGATHMYALTVPSGATNLRFVSSGGTGDLDLYVKFGSQPTSVAGGYDLKSDGATTAETISIATPQAGTYYLLTNGWAAYSGVSLVGAYTAAVVSGPVVSLSPTALNFGSVTLGNSSTVQVVIITNTGTAALSFPVAFTMTGDFSFGGTGTCTTGVTYAPNTSCTASVKFTPTVSGTRTGTLVITDNAGNSPQVVQLTGVGGTATITPPPPPPSPNGTAPTAAHYLYVAPTGSDSNTGTQSAPFKTILKASQVAVADTVIHVAPGTYTGGFKTTTSGTATGRITYYSDTKWGAKIVPTATSDYVWRNDGGYTDIIGFEITGLGVANIARLGIALGGGNSSVQNNHVHHIANTITCTNSGGAAIVADDGGNNPNAINYDFTGNLVHDIGQGASCNFIQGLYLSTSGTIKNNIVYNSGYDCIHLWHDANHVNVANNTVFNCTRGILAGTGDKYLLTTPGDYYNVYNNIIVDTNYAIQETSDGTGYGTHNSFVNNLILRANVTYAVHSENIVSGSILADPLFVNYIKAGGGDYHLQSGSPAIDRGSATYAPPTDFDGKSRPQGAGYDIGAYER